MRKLLLLVALVVAGLLAVRRLRPPRSAAVPSPLPPVPVPAGRLAEPTPAPVPDPPMRAPDPGPPPPTTNGERVLLMSISSLEGRGEEASAGAVVAHVAAGEIDPDEGTIDALLHRMAASGLLVGADGDGEGPYRLTATGQAALLDGSPARRSPAGAAADELSAPTSTA